jgi:hypothetical protein
MLLLQCLTQRISLSVVFPMLTFLVVHKLSVIAMELGEQKISSVNATLGMRLQLME